MNKEGNILVLSAGRRVEPIQDFKTEAIRFSDGIGVLITDMNPRMSSAYHASDGAFSVLSVQSEDYTDHIFDLAVEGDIGSIIPIIDTELYKLLEARTRFEKAGTHIVISDSELITSYRDKRKTVGLFAHHGIHPPEVYDRNRLVYSCFVKPCNGSCTIGTRRLDQATDLTPEVLAGSKLMFCQLIDIAEESQEFTVNMCYGWKGHLKCAVPRERSEVRTGEVNKGVTRRNSLYGLLTGNMTVLEGACGCIATQSLFNGYSDALYGAGISPRFGGDFPLTYAAGGNHPDWLIREYLYGEEILFPDRWGNNLITLRYDARALMREQDWS